MDISAIATVLQEISAKKLFLFLVALVIFSVGLSVYEKITDSYKLSKLERSTIILEKLESFGSNDKKLISLRSELISNLDELVHSKKLGSKEFEVNFQNILKFIFAAAPWFLLLLVFLFKTKNKAQFFLLLFFASITAVFFGWIGMLLPTIWWPYFNIIIFPFGYMVLFVLPFIVIPQFEEYRNRAEFELRKQNGEPS